MDDSVHILYDHVLHFVGRVDQSVRVRNRIPVGTRFSTQPPVLYNGYRVHPGV